MKEERENWISRERWKKERKKDRRTEEINKKDSWQPQAVATCDWLLGMNTGRETRGVENLLRFVR
jgi:hypothetical protein